jgi:hypothetical protein
MYPHISLVFGSNYQMKFILIGKKDALECMQESALRRLNQYSIMPNFCIKETEAILAI